MSSRKISTTRRTALAGGAALVLGGVAAAGVASAQQRSTPGVSEDVLFFREAEPIKLGERREEWLKAVAGKLGVTPERLDQAIQDVAKEQGMPPLPLLLPPARVAIDGGPGTFSLKLDTDLSVAAKALAISEEQLRKEAATASLNDVARAHGVDAKVVADALKAERRANLDKAVADGKIPADIADRLKSHLDDEIDHLMRMPGVRGNLVFRFERAER
jgi:membrane-bound lytic murein transglycosylase B